MGDKSILAERLEALAAEQGIDTSGLIQGMEATMERMKAVPFPELRDAVPSLDPVGIDMHRLAEIIFTATFVSNSSRLGMAGNPEMLGYVTSGKELAALLFAEGN